MYQARGITRNLLLAGLWLAAGISVSEASSRMPGAPSSEPAKKQDVEVYMPQVAAFQTAGEVMSAYGQYLMEYGPMQSAETRAAFARNVNACVNGSAACDKQQLMIAMIHYNMGRKVRAMILENNTNAALLKNIGPRSAAFANKASPSEIPERKPFHFDPATIQAAREREILGDNFLKDYRIFMDSNLSLKQEDAVTFARHKKTQESGHDEQMRENNGQVVADLAKFNNVRNQQNSANIQKRVQEFERGLQDLKAPTISAKDGRQVVDGTQVVEHMNDNGLGMAFYASPKGRTVQVNYIKDKDGTDRARDIATTLNKNIDYSIESQRKAASPDGTKRRESYSLNIDHFDQFLDEIWPPSAGSRKK